MSTPDEIKSDIEPLRVSSNRVALARAVGFITDRHFAHCRVAQPGFLGNLRSSYPAYALGSLATVTRVAQLG